MEIVLYHLCMHVSYIVLLQQQLHWVGTTPTTPTTTAATAATPATTTATATMTEIPNFNHSRLQPVLWHPCAAQGLEDNVLPQLRWEAAGCGGCGGIPCGQQELAMGGTAFASRIDRVLWPP